MLASIESATPFSNLHLSPVSATSTSFSAVLRAAAADWILCLRGRERVNDSLKCHDKGQQTVGTTVHSKQHSKHATVREL
jgi:hypothetical protein